MTVTLTAEELQALIDLAKRAPMTLAEQLFVGSLIEKAKGQIDKVQKQHPPSE